MKSSAPNAPRPVPPPRHYRVLHAILCPVMKLMGLSCRQFAELASFRMDRPLSRWESARFRFHRTMCGLCRRLPTQLENLRTLTRCACGGEGGHPPAGPAGGVELSAEAHQRLRETLAAEQAGTRTLGYP